MLRRLKFLIGADPKASSPLALPAPESKCLDGDSSSLVPEALHEIAVYIHRFHNLDLFQQGYAEFLAFSFFILDRIRFFGLVDTTVEYLFHQLLYILSFSYSTKKEKMILESLL
ncbi:hypothetical protein SUGI_0828200 [Cryptomeria japonica]|nr:hypothetical protein SUGI_0828200 [Cryptomeria japonica]